MSWRSYRKQLLTARRLENCGYFIVIISHFNNLTANLQKSERELKAVDAERVGVRRDCKHPRAVSIADYLGWLPQTCLLGVTTFYQILLTLRTFFVDASELQTKLDWLLFSNLRDLSGTSIESLPSVGLDKLEELRIQNTPSLKQIPSVYNFKVS